MMRKLRFDSAVFIAGFTALLYTWSTAFHHGFLYTLRLDADMMERSFHQVIYSGLLISVAPVIILLLFSAFILFLYSHLMLPSYIDWAKKSIKTKRKIVKFRRSWLGKRSSPPIELRAKALFAKVALFAFVGFFYVVSLAYFESLGNDYANDTIRNHLESKNDPTEIVKLKIDKEERNLRFLGCGSRVCAGIEEDTNLVVYYSSSMGYSYLYQTPNVKKVSD